MAEEQSGSGSLPSSHTNSCPICLAPVVQESYLDQCFHEFCYNCIVRWTEVVAGKHSQPTSSVNCPLCKRENFSIIHGYDGSSFQRHYINQDIGNSVFFSKAHKYRLQCYYVEPGAITDKFDVPRYWKSHRYLQPNKWLDTWLRREIQALIQEEDVDIIVHHIHGAIDSLRRNEKKCSRSTPEMEQEGFRALLSQVARPFLTGRTDRFVIEVELFLASGLNIEAYDKVYIQNLGWKVPGVVIEDAHERTPLVSFLCFFDEDSDEIE